MEELRESTPARRLPFSVTVANRLITPDLINRAFRTFSASGFADGVLDRLAAIGLPRADGAATLARIRSWDAWPGAWERLAAEYIATADVATDCDARRHDLYAATLALHAAQLLVMEPLARKRMLGERAAMLYTRVAPLLDPPSARVALPYRDTELPGYLSVPAAASPARPAPLVVFFNGGSTVKEELNGWRAPFLARGLATLALDNPGTGEAWATTRFTANQHSLIGELRRLIAATPALNGKIALVGVSLGGMIAVDLATEAPDLAAVVTITTPFAPGEYITQMAPLTQWEVVHVTGFPMDCQPYLCAAGTLATRAPRLTMPLLVIGAGRDRIVPPREAKRLYGVASPPRTLHWYPRAGHCCFSHLDLMLANMANWLKSAMSDE